MFKVVPGDDDSFGVEAVQPHGTTHPLIPCHHHTASSHLIVQRHASQLQVRCVSLDSGMPTAIMHVLA